MQVRLVKQSDVCKQAAKYSLLHVFVFVSQFKLRSLQSDFLVHFKPSFVNLIKSHECDVEL